MQSVIIALLKKLYSAKLQIKSRKTNFHGLFFHERKKGVVKSEAMHGTFLLQERMSIIANVTSLANHLFRYEQTTCYLPSKPIVYFRAKLTFTFPET